MKKVLEKRILNSKYNPLVFGKCIFEQPENKNKFVNDYLSAYKHLNLSYDHSPLCPMKGLYDNKKEEEIMKIQEHFNDLKDHKNKNVSFASVGIIFDKLVNIFSNYY